MGPYEVVSALGAGGMGEVSRARDPRLGREVAVKVLPERLSSDPDARVRFEREAKADDCRFADLVDRLKLARHVANR